MQKNLKFKNVEYEILSDKIIKNFSFEVKNGEIYTLFGPSGCGKTTLLRLISGLINPKKGLIENNFLKTAYLFQEDRLLDNLNVFENIALCMDEKNLNTKTSEIYTYLKMVGFDKKDFKKYPFELSGGMKKRVAFMRAYLSKPDLMLLDEPFSGLDNDLKNILSNLILDKVSKKQMACILVTHDRFEAIFLSHKINFLSKKGMQIYKVLNLGENFSCRDSAFIKRIIDDEFEGIVYYD